MENKKRALGKGLEELFKSEALDVEQLERKILRETKSEEIIEISLSKLRPNPYQPRKHFDEEALNELKTSILEHGVLQPIIVKPSIHGYEIVAGERRFRASKMAGLETIPAIVKDFSDDEMMEIALLENLQREDLSAIEEAKAYVALLEKTGLTQQELADKLGKSRSHITNIIGLLRLPEEIQKMVLENKISMGHARVLSKYDDPEIILELAEKVIKEGLSVRQLENSNYSTEKKPRRKKEIHTKYQHLENLMREKIGNKVTIKNNKITIFYNDKEDLKRILEVLSISEEEL